MDRKISDTTIEIEKVVPQVVETVKYEYSALIAQREAILEHKRRDNETRDAEIAEVDDLIARCESLGLKAEPVEKLTIVEEPIPETPIEKSTTPETIPSTKK